MKNLIKAAGSLPFAIFLIASLLALLVVSTLLESAHGTPFAQKTVYQAGWFDLFLGLFAVSIVSSTLTRWPFKLKHTGFIVTHIGILLLLAGSLVSRLSGSEGQILLYEGEKSGSMLQTGYEVVARREGGKVFRTDLDTRRESVRIALDAVETGLELRLDEISENARRDWRIEEGGPDSAPNAAVRLKLESERAGFSETFWMVEKHPQDPSSADRSIGPARLVLKRERAPVTGETLYVRSGPGTEEVAIDLLQPGDSDIRVGEFLISGLRYYPDARVNEENRLVSVSDKPLNPAVEFEWSGPGGKKRRVAYFAIFPDFESVHEKVPGRMPAPRMRLEVPGSSDGEIPPPSLAFTTNGNKWSYISRSSKGSTDGTLEAGKSYETGWMDFRFQPLTLASRAEVRETVEQQTQGKGELAARAVLEKDGKVVWEDRLFEARPKTTGLPGGLALVVRRKNLPVPFVLELQDFRKVDYPGTRSAMAYESDVTLEDAAARTRIQKTISMNKPLDYAGYRIFQSSFIQDPDTGREASVFTVAKNPGIGLIYGGAVVLFMGVFVLFYVKPLSSFHKK